MSCITLLSDFGLQDSFVASVKGVLMQYVPQVQIVDITHLIEPYHIQQAGYLLGSAYRNFPKGSCHLVLADLFSTKDPRMIICEKDGYYFLAPDNGVLPLAFDSPAENVWLCLEVLKAHTFWDILHNVADNIKALMTGSPEVTRLQPTEFLVTPGQWRARIEGNTVECHVIHIDRFQNVVINLTKRIFDEVGKGRPFSIKFMRNEEVSELSRHYNDVKDGDKLCRFNESGYMEIAIYRGKAASLFGLKLHQDQHLIYNTIKITFQ